MSECAAKMDLDARAMADREGKYLTFSLGGEEYGIGILRVKEIIGMMPITTVPQTPNFVKGVINLRGKVIPVMDLRRKFGMEAAETTGRACIVVIEVGDPDRPILTGMVVDAVSEVLNIKAADLEEVPAFGAELDTDYILAMAKMNGRVKILLDIRKVLGTETVPNLEN